jgi:hypothetical protein
LIRIIQQGHLQASGSQRQLSSCRCEKRGDEAISAFFWAN